MNGTQITLTSYKTHRAPSDIISERSQIFGSPYPISTSQKIGLSMRNRKIPRLKYRQQMRWQAGLLGHLNSLRSLYLSIVLYCITERGSKPEVLCSQATYLCSVSKNGSSSLRLNKTLEVAMYEI